MPENRRPVSVTLLVIFIFGLALWNGIRLVQTFAFWPIMKEYQAHPGPLYSAIISGFWFITCLFIVLGLWHGKSWSWFVALGGAVGYGLWYWFDRLILQEAHSNWPFSLLTTVILLSSFSVLFRQRAMDFFNLRIPSKFLSRQKSRQNRDQ